MNNPNLDDPQLYREGDPAGMLDSINGLAHQCELAWQEAGRFDLPSAYAGVDKVVVLGMGGSAIGADLLRGLAAAESEVPILVNRDYELPAFVDAGTLVIASSYSGGTEETLTALDQAIQRGAKLLAITTGGKLKEIARQKRIPVFTINFKAQPRAALGFSLMPLLAFLQRLGFLSDKSADVAEMLKVMAEVSGKMRETVPASTNPAKQMAQRLAGSLPVIYGAGVLAEVAHRWKTQINENSKAWAFYEVFPELNHNAVVGYQFPKEVASAIRVVMLRAASLGPRIRLRYEVTCRLLEQAGVAYEYVEGIGESPLSQVMGLVLTGDYASYYLALLYRTDPTQVKVIDYLKAELAKG